MKICKNCGKELDDQCAFCFYCGTKLAVTCLKCGAELNAECRFCFKCGAPVGAGNAATVNQETGTAETKNNELFDFSGMEEGFDEQLAKQEEYDKKLALAKSYIVRKRYDEARAIYDGLIEADPTDINGYLGYVRIVSENYTVMEGAAIDEAIAVVKAISEADGLSGVDPAYAEYEEKRAQYFVQKEEEAKRIAEERRRAEEARKAAEAARVAEEKRKAEAARKAAEDARRAEEERKRKYIASFQIENGVLNRYVGDETDVVVPNGVKEIGESAFHYKKCVRKITLPEGVTKISFRAFENSGLEQINIPSSVNNICVFAFSDCSSLKEVKFANSYGWYFNRREKAFLGKWKETRVELSSETFSDPSTAAERFKDWNRFRGLYDIVYMLR